MLPATPVSSLDDMLAAFPDGVHPVSGDYKVIPSPVRMSRTAPTVRRPAPLPGEHNDEVLQELGMAREDIERLRAEGVLRGRRR